MFDGGSVVTELDAEDKVKAGSIRGIELVSQRDSKDNSYYYLNNYHGDVIGLTDTLGDIVNSYSYDAFGNTLEASEQVHNRFRYSGEQFDPITNQYYLRARFYNPVVGRFTQEDEYRGDGLNLYAYVDNNPVNYVDPSGYAMTCERKAELYKKYPNVYENMKASKAARESSRFRETQNPATRKLSKEDTIATIKSTRRYVEKLMKQTPGAQQMLKDGNLNHYGTYFHNRVFKRLKTANIEGLEIDKTIIKPGTSGGEGNIRRPDFQWKRGTSEYDVWDLKPNGYDWQNTQQYKDIVNWTNIVPTQFNYNR